MARTLIVILGMHRGGTSLVAKAVHTLGIELGDKLHPPSGTENPTGFWEDEEFLDVNERVLAALGASWHSLVLPESIPWTGPALAELKREAAALLRERLSRYSSWGFKDPRTSRLIPFWKDVFLDLEVDPSYVIALRDPLSVAGSLERRNGFLEIRSHVLWLEHMLGALQGTENTHRVFVDYDALVEHPVTQLRRLAKELGIRATKEVRARIPEFANGFVSDELRHHRTAADSAFTDQRIPELVRRIYSLLHDLANDKTSNRRDVRGALRGVTAALREWRPLCEYIDRTDQFPELTKRLNQLGGEHAHALSVVNERDAQLQEISTRLAQLGDEFARAQGVVQQRDVQLAELNARLTQLGKDHAHAQEVVRERDTQLQEASTRVSQLGKEYAHAQDVVRERDVQLAELNARLTQLGKDHAHAQDVVRERDVQLAELNARLTQLGKDHAHAQDVVRERDVQLAELNARLRQLSEEYSRVQSVLNERESELRRIKTHWYWRVARLIIRSG